MTCATLAETLARMRPELTPTEIARLCLLILGGAGPGDDLHDPATLQRVWKSSCFRLDAATDQHAAVSDELDALLADDPVQFNPEQLWTLLRAVKVQSQLISLFAEMQPLA